jgi:hypothetical protein
MRNRAGVAAALLLFLSIPPAWGQTRKFEVEAAYSGWTLAPFHPLIERRTETAAREAFRDALGSTLLGSILSPLATTSDFGGSSGRSFTATVWKRLGRSRFSIGFRADAFEFDLPYTIEARETVAIIGIPLVEIEGRSVGTVRVRGLGGSVLGRWTAVESRIFDLALIAGVTLFPYEGKIDQDIQAALRSPLGDAILSGPYDLTIAEARRWSEGIPRAILSPTAGVAARFWLSGKLGISASVAASQGVFASGGLVFGF